MKDTILGILVGGTYLSIVVFVIYSAVTLIAEVLTWGV